jgi:uncharacterized membrane protein YebE (DUF533 family)
VGTHRVPAGSPGMLDHTAAAHVEHLTTLVQLGAHHQVIAAPAAGISWATIATSVGGVATAGALLVSLFVLWQNNKTQRQAQQDRHREHASHISFWITLVNVEEYYNERHARPGPKIEMTLHVVNTSDRPAMAVLALAGVRSDVWRDAATADGVERMEERAAEWTAVAVAPGDHQEIPLDLKAPRSVVKIVADYCDDALIGELHFTDAAGVDWVRTHDGRLIERRSPAWAKNLHLSLGQRDEQRRNLPRRARGFSAQWRS